jgi:UDP-glucose 4-epimerase
MSVPPEVVLLGANGYLGRHLALVMKRMGRPFLAVGRGGVSVDGHRPFLSANMDDLTTLAPALSMAKEVFVFAGRTGTLDGFDRPNEFIDSNEKGLLNLLNLVRETRASPRIVFPSTRLVYRGDNTRALSEDSQKECRTLYAMNKLACEAYLRMYANLFDMPYTVFRICVPFGNSVPGAGAYGTMQHFIAKAKRGEDITIFGDGEQRRTLIHAEDLACLLLESVRIEKTQNQIYNVGGSDILSISQIAQRIATVFGVGVGSMPWPQAHLAIETGDTVFDDTALRGILTPRYEWTFDRWLDSLNPA